MALDLDKAHALAGKIQPIILAKAKEILLPGLAASGIAAKERLVSDLTHYAERLATDAAFAIKENDPESVASVRSRSRLLAECMRIDTQTAAWGMFDQVLTTVLEIVKIAKETLL